MPDTPVTSFYTETIMQSPAFTSAAPYRALDLLEPVTRDAVQKIVAGAAQAGVTLQVLETFRSVARQEALYAQGATQLKQVGVHHYDSRAIWGSSSVDRSTGRPTIRFSAV